MKTRGPILAFTGALCLSAVAQYEPDTLKPLPLVCDVFVLPGGQAESMYAIGLEQWRTLVPKSELLVTDLSDHKYDNHRDRDFARSALFAASISLRMGGAGRVTRSGAYLRAGFAFQHHAGNDLQLRKETRVPFDTLTSSQTGTSTFIDSLKISTYDLTHEYSQLALDGSVIFMKEYPKRWALYGGGGVQLGFAFDGRARVSHRSERTTDPRITSPTTSGGPERDLDSEEEEFRTKDDLCFALYVPLGVTYRLAKKRAFWRALNLCYEMRPSFSLGGVPELDPGARVVVGQYFGLRVDLVK